MKLKNLKLFSLLALGSIVLTGCYADLGFIKFGTKPEENENDEESTNSRQSDETFYELSIPQNIQFRGIDYYMITESCDFFGSHNVDSVIAFLINEEDLSSLSLINPENEYCVVSDGFLFYAYGQPIFPIWSIHDIDIKDAIVISSPNETTRFLFRNCI